MLYMSPSSVPLPSLFLGGIFFFHFLTEKKLKMRVVDVSDSFPKFPPISHIFPSPPFPPPPTDRPPPTDGLPSNDQRPPTDTVPRPTLSQTQQTERRPRAPRISISDLVQRGAPERTTSTADLGSVSLPLSLSLSLSLSPTLSFFHSDPVDQRKSPTKSARAGLFLDCRSTVSAIRSPSLCDASSPSVYKISGLFLSPFDCILGRVLEFVYGSFLTLVLRE
jgi:hypothetical protein